MSTRLDIILDAITHCGAEIGRVHERAGYHPITHVILQDGATFRPTGRKDSRHLEEAYPRIAKFLARKGYVLDFRDSWIGDSSGRYWPTQDYHPRFIALDGYIVTCADAPERIAHGLLDLDAHQLCLRSGAYAIPCAFNLYNVKGLHQVGARYWYDAQVDLSRFRTDDKYIVIAQQSIYFVGRRSVIEREN